jgi:hypothetical protein
MQLVNFLPHGSDFQYFWEITRDFIFTGQNPYTNPTHPPFTYPLPVILIYSPFALIENEQIARAIWITFLQVTTAIFAILSIRIPAWLINRWWSVGFIIFAILWFPSMSVYIQGSHTALIAVFLGGSLLAIKNQNDEIAGLLLGLAFLQPRVTFLIVILILLWGISTKRWMVHFWLVVTFIFLSGVGLIFTPSWLTDFFWSTLRNVDLSPGFVILNTTFGWWPGVGNQVGWGFLIISLIILLVEWWLVWGKGSKRLIWVVSLTILLTIWIGIRINIDHIYMLLFSLSVIFSAWDRRWGRSGKIFFILGIALLLPSLWSAFLLYAQRGIPGHQNPILMIGFPFLILIGLYWVRWWFNQPAYLDQISMDNL